MKTRSFVFVFTLFLAGALVWLLQSIRPLKPKQPPAVPVSTPEVQVSTASPVSSSGVAPIVTQDPRSKGEVMSEQLLIQDDQPIEFYGKVIDQSGEPVGGAKVRGGVMVEKVWMGGHFVDHYTVTDAAGNFAFHGLRGAQIVIQPSKEGYEFRPSLNRNFYYSLLHRESQRHYPNQAKPEVFVMWKRQGAEVLFSGDKFFGIKGDGTPFTVDLIKGRKTEGRMKDGDLVISVKQPVQIPTGQSFDWSFSVEAIGGGVSEAVNKQYLNEAPAGGYEPQITQELKAGDRGWSDAVSKTFFVKSRNGSQFACVTAQILANYQGAAVFSIHYLVNPKSGSRNLESDPNKQMSVP